MKNKKAQATTAIPAILVLVLGLSVITLVLIFTGVLGGKVYQLEQEGIAEIGGLDYLEAQTFYSATATSLTYSPIVEGTISFTNYSNGVAVTITNYTINYATGSILSSAHANGWKVNVTYDYGNNDIRVNVEDGIKAGFESNKETAEFMPVVSMAIIIFLVLSMVIGFTALTGNNRGNGGVL